MKNENQRRTFVSNMKIYNIYRNIFKCFCLININTCEIIANIIR